MLTSINKALHTTKDKPLDFPMQMKSIARHLIQLNLLNMLKHILPAQILQNLPKILKEMIFQKLTKYTQCENIEEILATGNKALLLDAVKTKLNCFKVKYPAYITMMIDVFKEEEGSKLMQNLLRYVCTRAELMQFADMDKLFKASGLDNKLNENNLTNLGSFLRYNQL